MNRKRTKRADFHRGPLIFGGLRFPQATHNGLVAGSNPARPTNLSLVPTRPVIEIFGQSDGTGCRSIELRFGPMLGFKEFWHASIRGYRTHRTGNNRFLASVESQRHALDLRRPRFSSR
jgi:hypothetical protein